MKRTTAASNAESVSRILSSIPERAVRSLSGTAFSLDGARACSSDPTRLACLARLLHWLAPLNPLGGDDQRALGLHGPAMRPLHAEEEPGEEPGGLEVALEDGHGDCTTDLVH